jgi:hypothetical protein
MVLEPRKLDVTNRVTGKLKDGEVELYLDNQPIGRMALPLDGITMERTLKQKKTKYIKATHPQKAIRQDTQIVMRVAGVRDARGARFIYESGTICTK